MRSDITTLREEVGRGFCYVAHTVEYYATNVPQDETIIPTPITEDPSTTTLSKQDIKALLVTGPSWDSDEVWRVVDEYDRAIFEISYFDRVNFNWLDDDMLGRIIDRAYQSGEGEICIPGLRMDTVSVVLTGLEDNILHGMRCHLDHDPVVYPVEYDLGHLTKGHDFAGLYGLGFVEELVEQYPGQISADVTTFSFKLYEDTWTEGVLKVWVNCHT